jgi:hypothetical protein
MKRVDDSSTFSSRDSGWNYELIFHFYWLLSLVVGLLCVTNQDIYVQKNCTLFKNYVFWMLCEILIHIIYLVL